MLSDLSSFIPSASSLAGSVASTKDQLVNYATGGASDVLNQTWSKVSGAFSGVTDKFKSLTSGGPALKSLVPAVPTEPSATAASITEATGTGGNDALDTSHKVRLVSSAADAETMALQYDPNFPVEPLKERVVEFDLMPEITEVRNVEYEALQTPQMPGEFQKYKGTKSTQWTITGMFTCRTKTEAYKNYILMNTLRGWSVPYFGDAQIPQFSGSGKLGAPPPVLQFSGWRGIVGRVPVVITSLNWNWPRDCDWIPTGILDDNGQEIPFPTVMNVNINLVESFSPAQFNKFDLVAFRNGRMIGAWGGNTNTTAEDSPAEADGGEATGNKVDGTTEEPAKTDPKATLEAAQNDYVAKKAALATSLKTLNNQTQAAIDWMHANPNATQAERSAKAAELDAGKAAKDAVFAEYKAAEAALTAAGGTPT